MEGLCCFFLFLARGFQHQVLKRTIYCIAFPSCGKAPREPSLSVPVRVSHGSVMANPHMVVQVMAAEGKGVPDPAETPSFGDPQVSWQEEERKAEPSPGVPLNLESVEAQRKSMFGYTDYPIPSHVTGSFILLLPQLAELHSAYESAKITAQQLKRECHHVSCDLEDSHMLLENHQGLNH